MTKNTTKKSKKLDSAEVADAALTAALVVALLATGRLLGAGSAFQVIASVVLAVLAARRRTRAAVIATISSACIAIILGGLGPVSYALVAGAFGWAAGFGLRRGWGKTRSLIFTVLIGWPSMAASVMFFYPAVALNRKLRLLVFENIENQAKGYGNIVGRIAKIGESLGMGFLKGPLDWTANALTVSTDFVVTNWLWLIPASELLYSSLYAFIIYVSASRIIRQLEATLVDPVSVDLLQSNTPAPVPVRVQADALQRNGHAVTAPIDFAVAPLEHVAVLGPNGAGKSTLLDTLAGLINQDSVQRAGQVGLGSKNGIARVGQRPEAQVVGTTVEEDLRWGLAEIEDVHAALARVGLSHIEPSRSTAELSGGELQRLALGSALRRDPSLLLVDEVTSMLDPVEQARVNAVLDSLDDVAIVRTTHRNDAAESDTKFNMVPRDGGGSQRLHTNSGVSLAELTASEHSDAANPLAHSASGTSTTDTSTSDTSTTGTSNGSSQPIALATVASSVTERKLLRLEDVCFSHHVGRPWQHDVLHDVNLSIHRYELTVIEGHNGSGKSTLARILAGLVAPTSGRVRPAAGLKQALATQHVRLQLLKPTVSQELNSLSGLPNNPADLDQSSKKQLARAMNMQTAIEMFELKGLLRRKIDELSGGEQRRVLLAGLVARGVSLLVLDEPLAGLDRQGRKDLAGTLDQLRLAGTSVVVISHDVEWHPVQLSQQLKITDGRLERVL